MIRGGDPPAADANAVGPGWFRVTQIGFWDDSASTGVPSEWPHPRDLVTRWDPAARERAVAYLKRGGAVAAWFGVARCRLCTAHVGSLDLWDGTYLWPQGLDHYVTAHDVALPDFFLRHLESGPEPPPPVELTKAPRLVRSGTEFKRWAASTAASPAPRPDAMSLPEARERAARLSTSASAFRVDEFNGRWHVQGAGLDAYVAPLLAEELDRLLLKHRWVDAPSERSEAVRIPFESREDGLHFAWVEGDVLRRAARVLLALRSNLGRPMAPEEVEANYKLASWGEIAEVVQTAHYGVGMWPLTHAPAPVDNREGALYFRLESAGAHWESVVDEGTVAFYLPPPYVPAVIEVELWALTR